MFRMLSVLPSLGGANKARSRGSSSLPSSHKIVVDVDGSYKDRYLYTFTDKYVEEKAGAGSKVEDDGKIQGYVITIIPRGPFWIKVKETEKERKPGFVEIWSMYKILNFLHLGKKTFEMIVHSGCGEALRFGKKFEEYMRLVEAFGEGSEEVRKYRDELSHGFHPFQNDVFDFMLNVCVGSKVEFQYKSFNRSDVDKLSTIARLCRPEETCFLKGEEEIAQILLLMKKWRLDY